MKSGRILRAAVAIAILAGTVLRTPAEERPWIEPDLDAVLNNVLTNPPGRWQVLDTWNSAQEDVQILPGSKVICVGSNQVIFHGKHDWTGTYDETSGELHLRRTMSATEVLRMETDQNVPEWARSMTAGQAVHEDMILTVKVEADGNLSMSGRVSGEKLDWEEKVDEETGRSDPATQKARIVADSNASKPLGATFTKKGISKETRDRLKQSLHMMMLFQHRDDLLHSDDSDVMNQVAVLEKSYAALLSSTGADEQRRLEEIGKTIDNLRTGRQREIAKNQQQILESASAHSSYYNPELQDILAKYQELKQSIASDPDNNLYQKILDDTQTRLLLYLGSGPDAMYAHDDYEKRAFLYGMIKLQSDLAHATAVAATSRAVAGACPEQVGVRSARASPKPPGVDAGVKWGKGIQGQGMPWEEYLAKQRPSSSRLPPNFKTFDFYDNQTGVATSAKTVDTTTSAKLADPTAVYSSIKGNIDTAAEFTHYELSGRVLDASQITSTELQVAVPEQTTPAQWAQINRAIDYGNTVGVRVVVTPVK